MSMKEDYQNYCERRAEFEKNPMSKYWTEQNTRYMEPVSYTHLTLPTT